MATLPKHPLQEIREKAGLDVSMFAEKLGVSRSALYRFERWQQHPMGSRFMRKLAAAGLNTYEIATKADTLFQKSDAAQQMCADYQVSKQASLKRSAQKRQKLPLQQELPPAHLLEDPRHPSVVLYASDRSLYGAQLRQLRRETIRLSTDGLAELIGVSNSSVSRVERGIETVTDKTIIHFSESLKSLGIEWPAPRPIDAHDSAGDLTDDADPAIEDDFNLKRKCLTDALTNCVRMLGSVSSNDPGSVDSVAMCAEDLVECVTLALDMRLLLARTEQ